MRTIAGLLRLPDRLFRGGRRGDPTLRPIWQFRRGVPRALWPAVLDIAPVLQHQFVQKEYDLVEARLATAVPLEPETENRLRQHILARRPRSMRVRFAYGDRIPRNAGGKFEEVVSEVAASPR